MVPKRLLPLRKNTFYGSIMKAGLANRFSGSLRLLAVGRSFGGLSAPPVICPYRAEQATGLAGGHDYRVSYRTDLIVCAVVFLSLFFP